MNILKRGYCKTVIMFLLLQLVIPFCNGQQNINMRSMKYSTRSSREAALWQEDLRSRFIVLMKINDLPASKTGLKLFPEILKTEERGSYILKKEEINSTPGCRIIKNLPLILLQTVRLLFPSL